MRFDPQGPGPPWEACTRRSFLGGGLAGLIWLGLAPSVPFHLRAPLAIGLVGCGRDPGGPTPEYVLGVELGIREAAQAGNLLGKGLELIRREDLESRGADAAGRSLLRGSRPHAILGGCGKDDAAALAELAAGSGRIAMNLRFDPDSLGAAGDLPSTFHLVPSAAERGAALLSVLAPLGLGRWLLVASSDPAAHRLYEGITALHPDAERRITVGRAWLDAAPELESAGEIDGLLLHLAREEREAFFAGPPRPALPIADLAGEEAPSPTAAGVRRFHVTAWNPEGEAYGAGELNERFRRLNGVPMHAEAWAGWVAVKALWEAWLAAPEQSASAVRAMLADGRTFDGHKGVALAFGPTRRLRQPLYVMETRDGSAQQVGEWSPPEPPGGSR